METYDRWEDVPEHLKTKTGLNKAGLRRRPKQAPAAKIDTTWGSRGQYGGEYELFDIRECLKRAETTPAQKAEKAARLKQLYRETHCRECGDYVSRKHSAKQGGRCDDCYQRRQECQQWAKEMIDLGCVILDTETTGLTDADRIVDLAIVSAAGDTLFHSLINPQMHIYAEAQAIHGITDDMVKDAPILDAVRSAIQRVLTFPLVIYNADFDAPFLRRAGLTIPGEPECLMRQFSRYYGAWSRYHDDWKWQSLDVACHYFKIQRLSAHRALADAQDAAKVLNALAT